MSGNIGANPSRLKSICKRLIFLNFFDSSVHFEFSFVNMAADAESFERSIRIPPQKDGFDDIRAEYSQMLKTQLAQGNNGLTKTKSTTA